LFGAAIIGRELLTIYRPQFALGYGILLILILARTFDAYANQFTSVISGYDRPELVFRTNVVFVVINTLLNFVLIWAFGWYGAAVATAFSALVELVLAYYYVTTAIGYPEIPYRQILYQFVAAAGMAVVLYTLTQHITVNNYSVVATVFIGAAVYLILLLIISKPVRQKFRMLAPAWIPE
jgi:O-antigen/teichoic acid export membrane protein